VQASASSLLGIRGLKRALWLAAAAPLVDLAWLAYAGALGPNPQEALLRATGLWSLVLLLVTLSITPVRRWMNWAELIRVRRMLGLWAFAYAVIHLLGFWAFEHSFDWAAVFADGLTRPFVTAGLLSIALLIPLAITSNTWSMRMLGSGWKKLHRLAYVVAAISVLHFYLHKVGKNDFLEPTIALLVLLGLFLGRALGPLRGSPARKSRP
jgi:methionine sulfoxide reductase heme-binding subunit